MSHGSFVLVGRETEAEGKNICVCFSLPVLLLNNGCISPLNVSDGE